MCVHLEIIGPKLGTEASKYRGTCDSMLLSDLPLKTYYSDSILECIVVDIWEIMVKFLRWTGTALKKMKR